MVHLAQHSGATQRDSDQLPGTETFPATAHIFYGKWKVAKIVDDLPKFIGYPNESQQVDRDAEPLPANFGVGDFNPHVPRDMVGYGEKPPHPQWPNNARIAVSFVLNYEEGGENLTLNGDQFAELYLTEYGAANGSKPPANVRNLSVESAYEFGSHRGFWRVLDLFRRNGLTFTSWSVGRAVEQNPQVVKGDGRRRLRSGEPLVPLVRSLAHVAGGRACADPGGDSRHQVGLAQLARAKGWYTGRQSINTRRLVYQTYKELGLHKELYDSDAYDEDLPYWVPLPMARLVSTCSWCRTRSITTTCASPSHPASSTPSPLPLTSSTHSRRSSLKPSCRKTTLSPFPR